MKARDTEHGTRSSTGPARKAGFTLVELLVVLSIIAILSLMLIPGFAGMNRYRHLKGAARDIQMTMLKARNHAVKNRRQHLVYFEKRNNAAGENVWNVVLRDSANVDGKTDSDANGDIWNDADDFEFESKDKAFAERVEYKRGTGASPEVLLLVFDRDGTCELYLDNNTPADAPYLPTAAVAAKAPSVFDGDPRGQNDFWLEDQNGNRIYFNILPATGRTRFAHDF
jgi:prepilin-type N-terminal cleavage/methylation domain-containing protein